MAEITKYENFTLMMQHSVLAIQHAHSFATKVEAFKKELVQKTQDAAGYLVSLNNVETKIKALLDQAKVTRYAQDQAKERAEIAETVAEVLKSQIKNTDVKTTEAKAELQEALATKEVEIKVVDEKAFSEGQAVVQDEYKAQVNQACNRGYYLGWTATLNKLSAQIDSPLRDINQLNVPFPSLQKTLKMKPKRRRPRLRKLLKRRRLLLVPSLLL